VQTTNNGSHDSQ